MKHFQNVSLYFIVIFCFDFSPKRSKHLDEKYILNIKHIFVRKNDKVKKFWKTVEKYLYPGKLQEHYCIRWKI